MVRTKNVCVTAALALVALGAEERAAKACGGCFHGAVQQQESESVITDHRMVFSLSTAQSVLWDQVRYSGNPVDFAWVLPVRDGARVEISHDEWLSALDASTRVTVTSPTPPSSCGGSSSASSGGGAGCGLSGGDDTASAMAAAPTAYDPDAAVEGVEVLSQEVVGPYEAVILRSSDGDRIDDWLTTHHYVIPPAIAPVLRAYASDGFDFIALRLRPGATVRAMQPVRVVTRGADPTLPLRMVAAGVGAKVGLTLFVIGEGRWHPQNFPDAFVDFDRDLVWDPIAKRSNYTTLVDTALGAGEGRGWLTEAAVAGAGLMQSAYRLACPFAGSGFRGPCTAAHASASGTAAADAGCPAPVASCDDDVVALAGMHLSDVWITRLRASLPASALATDLRLEAAALQSAVVPEHKTERYSLADWDPCTGTQNATTSSSGSSSSSSGNAGCGCRAAGDRRVSPWLLVAVGAGALTFGVRAHRRRRRG